MVLSLMRRHAKSWLIKFLIGIIAVVFIFYFGYSFTSKQGLKVAYVNGEVITGQEYQKTYRDLLEALRRQYKGLWNENLIKVFDVKKRALENLINQKLITQEAKRLGLAVTEEEIQKAIMNYPSFQTNGRFDMNRYRVLLSHNRMKPEDFEATIAQGLLDSKLREFLFAFMEVTDREILNQYVYANEKVKIAFVRFEPDQFRKSVHVDQAALEKFFEKNKESYRVPEKIKAVFIEVDPEDFKDEVKLTEMEISDYYEYNLEAFSEPEAVRARHILFKVPKDASLEVEETVRANAQKVLKRRAPASPSKTWPRPIPKVPPRARGGIWVIFPEAKW